MVSIVAMGRAVVSSGRHGHRWWFHPPAVPAAPVHGRATRIGAPRPPRLTPTAPASSAPGRNARPQRGHPAARPRPLCCRPPHGPPPPPPPGTRCAPE
eukprot:930903-Prorocentrum_minimum.AAC.1